jgi:leucyl-tRNA synthetase
MAGIPGGGPDIRHPPDGSPGQRQAAGRFEIAADADEDTIKEAALTEENVQRFIQDKPVKKVIVVRDKLVNVVV